MKKSTISLLVLLCTLLFLGLLAFSFIGYRVINRGQQLALQAQESVRARQIVMAVQQFAYDHDGKLPSKDWAKEVGIYLAGGVALEGFAYNEALAGQHIDRCPPDIVTLFEAGPGVTVGTVADVLDAPRFETGYIVAFLDGHTEYLRDPRTSVWTVKKLPAANP